MKCCSKLHLGTKSAFQCLLKKRSKLSTPIRNDSKGDFMHSHNLYEIQSSIILRLICCSLDRNKIGWFGHPINNNPNRIMLPSFMGQTYNEIHIGIFPLADGYWYILRQPSCSLMFGLDLFKIKDLVHKIRYIPLQIIPPRGPLQVTIYLGGSRINGISRTIGLF